MKTSNYGNTSASNIKYDKLPKKMISKYPNITFGISAQSPDSFHLQNSMISSNSYLNPFVKIDQITLQKIKSPLKHSATVQLPRWTSRIHLNNYSHLSNQNGFLTARANDNQVPSGMSQSIQFDQSFEVMYRENQSKKIFCKKKGQFTTYLQNHLANIDFIGPILGAQRSQQKKNNTKRDILFFKKQRIQKIKQTYSLIKPNRSLSPLLQKAKIHRNRLKLNDDVHHSYKQKQNIKQKNKDFELPKINKKQLQTSLNEIKKQYEKFKNDNLTKSYFLSSLSSVKTVDFDKSYISSKIR